MSITQSIIIVSTTTSTTTTEYHDQPKVAHNYSDHHNIDEMLEEEVATEEASLRAGLVEPP